VSERDDAERRYAESLTPGAVRGISELLRLQRAHNEWLRQASPEERSKAAVAHLRYITSVEPGSYGYLFEDDDA